MRIKISADKCQAQVIKDDLRLFENKIKGDYGNETCDSCSGKSPVLAVDADANSNLNEVLGVAPEVTLGGTARRNRAGRCG